VTAIAWIGKDATQIALPPAKKGKHGAARHSASNRPAPPPEPFTVQVIIVDWLYREVDGLAEIKMPVLQHIAGHRNREVYGYLELTHDMRDSRAAAIYRA
jgi:hypothetical protein